MIPANVVEILIEIGRSGNPDDPATAAHLESIDGYDSINREHWRTWDKITDEISNDDLVALTKGLALAEKHHRWIGGSVAGAIWTFRQVQKRDSTVADEVADWILPRTQNPWVPYGSQNHGASTVEEFKITDRQSDSADNMRDSWTCPICGWSCADSDGCDHLAAVRFDDDDGSVARGVFYASSSELTHSFDELYGAVLEFAMIWLSKTDIGRKALTVEIDGIDGEAAHLRSVIEVLKAISITPVSEEDLEDKVPMEFYNVLSHWFRGMFNRLWTQQPMAVAFDNYEIPHSPGLTWTGTNYWATTGHDCLTPIFREINDVTKRVRELALVQGKDTFSSDERIDSAEQ